MKGERKGEKQAGLGGTINTQNKGDGKGERGRRSLRERNRKGERKIDKRREKRETNGRKCGKYRCKGRE